MMRLIPVVEIAFKSVERWQDLVPCPRRVTELSPPVVVSGDPSKRNRRIHRGRATGDSTPGEPIGASVERGIRQAPVVVGIAVVMAVVEIVG